MLKFHIRDEEGEEFDIEPIETEEVVEEVHDEELLSKEDLDALKDLLNSAKELKELASMAKQLKSLLNGSDNLEEVPEEGLEDEEVREEEFSDSEEEVVEEVVDTDEKEFKDSFGSLEKRKRKDSKIIESQEEIAQAWAKRYKGGK